MAATLEAILAALALLKEAFAVLHKDRLEKFEEEWKKDANAFLEAFKNNDSRHLAELVSKYSLSL